jgi:hypothetical protein
MVTVFDPDACHALRRGGAARCRQIRTTAATARHDVAEARCPGRVPQADTSTQSTHHARIAATLARHLVDPHREAHTRVFVSNPPSWDRNKQDDRSLGPVNVGAARCTTPESQLAGKCRAGSTPDGEGSVAHRAWPSSRRVLCGPLAAPVRGSGSAAAPRKNGGGKSPRRFSISKRRGRPARFADRPRASPAQAGAQPCVAGRHSPNSESTQP